MALRSIQEGRQYGRWTVLRRDGSDRHGISVWLCRCACGQVRRIPTSNLRTGASVSCGCYRNDVNKASKATHGHCRSADGRTILSSTYITWVNMHQRCTNPKRRGFKDYGGRGITVCERWQKFENFLADMGERPPGLSIDRVNNDGNYEPGNCRWATRVEQNRNQRHRGAS